MSFPLQSSVPVKSSGALVSVSAAVAAILLLHANSARADDVACAYSKPDNGTQTCTAQLKGTDSPDQTTWDSGGNGHSGAPGGPSSPLNFSLTSAPPGPLSSVDVGTTGGKGGYGYHADPVDTGFNRDGGNGGQGGAAGDIAATLGSDAGADSTTAGVAALTINSQGGAGGGSGQGSLNKGTSGTTGAGGNGGNITAAVDGNWRGAAPANSAIISTQGGTGGPGGSYRIGLSGNGGNGAVGGNGGNISLTLLNTQGGDSNQFNAGGGVVVQSSGGAGGAGGGGEAFDGTQGGTGGTGGTAGTVTTTVGSNVIIVEAADSSAALKVLSQGGVGGAGGGNAGSGGTAGKGGDADDVNVVVQGGLLQSLGAYAPGLLAQSIGGNGSDGGSASKLVVGPNGGAGSAGGAAGNVSVTGTNITITTGQYVNPTAAEGDTGVMAQSIGGGGGSGSPSTGVFAIGGSGGNAVDGKNATVDLQSQITTYGFHADGIAVQSIGGGGGKGGDATGDGAGYQMTVGGSGGGGGNGGTATLTNEAGSVITTNNDHASGLVVQSIGGGGGDGGAAYSKSVSVGFDANISVGGSGGQGGDGGIVTYANQTTNAAEVITYGSDSYGILAQSIGGGGGVGGMSTSKARSYGVKEIPDLPSIALSAALGGKGGVAGGGSSVTVGNQGLIETTGGESTGILAQSIGGGGGAGGDATASSTATGGKFNLAASFSFGGAGGAGGSGGVVNAGNSGTILTTGESADGMLVQSLGGGGGVGGAGDSKASASGDNTSISLTLSLGGNGGGGGDAQSVTASNKGGAIITLGDGAIGIGAQAVGGGGGRAGGAAGSTTGDYGASVTLGGSGGSGGSSSSHDNVSTNVIVTNTQGSTVATFGADATGIIAQSIGGGGGIGGKSDTNLGTSKSTGDGGNGSSNTSDTLKNVTNEYASAGNGAVNNYNTLSGVSNLLKGLLNGNVAAVYDDDPEGDLDDLAQGKGKNEDDNSSTKITLTVGLGGSGGTGGDAGAVQVNNDGTVATLGDHSDGIIAQSVGGGGGKGGASSTATSDDNSGSLDVGGTGGNGGDGGAATVHNTGTLITEGALANGIVAQSIGGGGGIGGIAASSITTKSKDSGASSAGDGAYKNLQITLGGNGSNGIGGDAGPVQVVSSGSIQTTAHDASGIIAQSVAGGGGIVKTLATDLEGNGGSGSTKQTDFDTLFKFGGADGSYAMKDENAGTSGLVNVTTQKGGTITTQGDDSYGILAQSVAGGGGLALGGKPVGSTGSDFFGSGQMTGTVTDDGVNKPTSGNSGLFVEAGDNITTSGKGAIGIVAQSIGGGGGLAGDTGYSAQYTSFGSGSNHNGNGGYVGITVDQGATVSTSGANAPAMFVQSIGGGGGRVTNENGAFIGTAGGTGTGGAIDITVNGTLQATGAGSGGIFAQSEGDKTSQSPINITVGSSGKIIVGQNNVDTSPNGESAGIYIDHGGMTITDGNKITSTQNTVTNNGLIQTYGSKTNAVAVYSTGGNTAVINNGTMAGDVLLTNGGGTGCFTNNGKFVSGDSVTVGSCGVTNAGTIEVGSKGVVGKTTISGDYVQESNGTLNIDADLKSGKADELAITGKATIAGVVNVNALTVSNKPVAVLTATGGVSVDPRLKQIDNSALFDFPVVASGNELDIQPVAHFNDAAAGLDNHKKEMAAYLQKLFDGGASFDDGFTALAKLPGSSVASAGNDYATSLRSMSGEALGTFGAFRVNSSRAFSEQLYGGCHDLSSDGQSRDSCSWAKFFGSSMDQDARGDTVGYHANAYTLVIGGQVGLTDHLALVGSIGSEKTQLHGDDQAEQIEGSAAVGGVGLNYANGPLELSGALDTAYGWYRSTRIVTVGDQSGTADAKPRQWQMGLHLHGGYSFALSNTLYVKPFLDGHAIRVTDDAFTEDGTSPFRLAVDGRTDTAWLGATGVEFGAHLPMHSGAELHPYFSAAAEFNQDRAWATTAHFADASTGPGFTMATAGPGTLGRFTLGADLINSQHLSFSIAYQPEVGSGYSAQAGTMRVSYTY
jgi:hypothetical protein